jgi:hypothetical protein
MRSRSAAAANRLCFGKPAGDLAMLVFAGEIESRDGLVVFDSSISPVLKKQIDNSHTAILGGGMESRPAMLLPRIYRSTVF